MNINNPTTFGVPNLSLSTSNSSGTGGALRADDTILVYDATVPTTIASGASAAVGDTSTAARRNHTHGMYTATPQSSQAALEAETNQDTYAPPDRIKYSPGTEKGWIRFDGSGTIAIDVSYNVTSIADLDVGEYEINWNIDFTSVDYQIVGYSSTRHRADTIALPTAGQTSVGTYGDDHAAADASRIYYGVHGTQA